MQMFDNLSIWGSDGCRYIQLIDGLGLERTSTRYSFLSEDKFENVLRENVSHGMQIYWREIISRAHLASMVAIFRSRHWMRAVEDAARAENMFSFTAALRGLIESAADSATALHAIPETFARDRSLVTRALNRDLGDVLLLADEIEDQLIHFSHARHISKSEGRTIPDSHRARTIRDYIEILRKGNVDKIVECYQKLCDFTHPGSSSVDLWFVQINEEEMRLAFSHDASLISDFLSEFRETLLGLIMFAFNPALITLGVLNYYPITQFQTPLVFRLELDGIPTWRKCKLHLKGALPEVRTQ